MRIAQLLPIRPWELELLTRGQLLQAVSLVDQAEAEAKKQNQQG
jgi:hypothetical protein